MRRYGRKKTLNVKEFNQYVKYLPTTHPFFSNVKNGKLAKNNLTSDLKKNK